MCIKCGCETSPHYMHGHRHHKRVITDKERKERLKSYAEELRKELTAVEQRLKELEN
ncbi:MAG: hypothetical protein ACOC6H_04775 [Thermoproteota archaeon]